MKKRALILLLALAVGCGACAVPAASETDALRLICLNIGKADCMLLLCQQEAYLIDTGYAQTWPALKAMLAQYGVKRLNGVFLTHCHEDHMGGLTPLAQSDIAVDAWYAAKIYTGVEESQHPAVTAAALRGQSVTWLAAGDALPVGGGGQFAVLGPLSLNTDNENNNSLVMRFSCPQGSILFAGDMKEEEETELLAAGAFSACDVLKAGHHGDNKATGKNLLSIVRPRAAVILTDSRQESDTPAASTLKRLASAGCAVYVSQDFHDALMITLKQGAEPEITDVRWTGAPDRAEGIALSISLEQDTLTLFNQGNEALALSGCAVYSTKGDELFFLPDAAVSPGGQYVIGSKVTETDTDFNTGLKRTWSRKNPDIAILYDAWGRVLACTDNGLEE